MPTHHDSLQIGLRAEERFAATARRLGWTVTPAPRDSNIHKHWDFEIRKDGYKREFVNTL